MKKIVLFLLILIFFTHCKNTEKQDFTVFERIFPIEPINIKPKQIVLAPSKEVITKIKQNIPLDSITVVFYPREVIETNEKFSIITDYIDTFKCPNNLIIPLGDTAASKGDIILTWNQRQTGMQRAYLMDKLKNKFLVHYLDEVMTVQMLEAGFRLSDLDDTIKPGTFKLISDNSWIGRSVVYNDQYAPIFLIVLKQTKDSLLTLWGNILKKVAKSDVYKLPLKPSVNISDTVLCPYYGQMVKAIVKDIDTTHGRIWVQANIDFVSEIISYSVGYGDFEKQK